MAADPSLGNVDYKEAFTLSSGSGVAALASPALSITKDILGIESVAPAEYQENIGQTFYDTSSDIFDQGGGGGGGGGGIPSIPIPTPTPDPTDPTPDPIDLTPTPTLPPGTTLTPTSFDYSQWPQFGPQYPGYNQYSWPNYVNQGLGQGPQFDYWNQIARTFPGMR